MGENVKQNFNVMVTGFSSNCSGKIAELIPTELTADHPLNIAACEITLRHHLFPKLSWAADRQEIKDLHEQHTVDLWIHLGRSQWNHVTCERRAYRQDFTSSWLAEFGDKGYYRFVDTDGQIADDVEPCPWMNVPMGLDTAIDVNDVVAMASERLKSGSLELRSHAEPGSHGCGFTFYESMANCYVREKPRNVMFCHVPPQDDEAIWENVRDVVLAVISASCVSIERTRARDPRLPPAWRGKFDSEP